MKGEMCRLMRKWTGNQSGNEPEMKAEMEAEMNWKWAGNEPEMGRK